MARPRHSKHKELPDNLYRQKKAKGYYYKYIHPITKDVTAFGYNKDNAIKAAKYLNEKLSKPEELIDKVLGRDETLGEFFVLMEDKILPNRTHRGKKLSPKTLINYTENLHLLNEAFGKYTWQQMTLKKISNYFDGLRPHAANKRRTVLSLCYKYAMAKGLTDVNLADNTMRQDFTKQRERLSLEGFYKIYQLSPQWFQNAMDVALRTLQSRQDLCRLLFSADPDKKQLGIANDDKLYIIRGKTQNYESAYIRVTIKDTQLEQIIQNCRDDIVSPYILHRQPERRQSRERRAAFKDHPTQLRPQELSRTFSKYRDKCGYFDHLEKEKRPTFHEIRSLGSWLYEQSGENPQMLLCHSDPRMTEIYTSGHGVKWIDATADLRVETDL